MASLDTSADSLSSCLEKAEGDLRSLSRQFEEEFHHRFSDSQVQRVTLHFKIHNDSKRLAIKTNILG